MEKNYSRRDFLKMIGAGAATVAMGTTLNSCKELEEEKMNIARLIQYRVFRQHQTDTDFDNYLFIREHKKFNDYIYFYLSVAEDKFFYDNIYVSLKDQSEINDHDIVSSKIPFETLLENFDMEDLGNAFDVVSSVLGTKPYYKASEIKKVPDLLRNRDLNKQSIKTR